MQLVVSVQSAVDLVSRTLCHVQQTQLGLDLVTLTHQCLRDLQDAGIVRQLAASDCFSQPVLEVTRLGRAVFKGSITLTRYRCPIELQHWARLLLVGQSKFSIRVCMQEAWT